eukprot:CAMPEP_0204041004 /NCGR_PEP_ID=MMETSP0360-20130528/92926_1 /ASSEMBLY_ACC=CAM_ASM_000342 /TAXON_ID=268821 /ORGANISM="Scrippsiella Hangoei, Strain SHTV-5" /LENGTH=36 /DNA_ID= /DNA_START= /DNA_END= /DNA_ORIENTATION=
MRHPPMIALDLVVNMKHRARVDMRTLDSAAATIALV